MKICNFAVLLDWVNLRLLLGRTNVARFSDARSDCCIAVVFLFDSHGDEPHPALMRRERWLGKIPRRR